MTTIIVGLGNPGARYADTRHNLGFRVLDALRQQLQAPDFASERDVQVVHLRHGTDRIFLLKPQTFMNESGGPVARFVRFYRIPLDRMWIAHDDVDLPFGELREAYDRGAAGHRGVESIMAALGSTVFHRLRIGLGSNRDRDLTAEDYVLQPFTPDEERALLGEQGLVHRAAALLWDRANAPT